MDVQGNLDLKQNQLQNSAMELLADFPVAPVNGELAFVISKLYMYIEFASENAWIALTDEVDALVHTESPASLSWVIDTTEFNDNNVVINIFDENNKKIIPDDVDTNTANQITVTFSVAQAGKAVVMHKIGLTDSVVFGGTIDGYHLGGIEDVAGVVDTIQSYSYASDGNSTDVGSLTSIRSNDRQGVQSDINGYVLGGGIGETEIEKMDFATNTSAVQVAVLTQGRVNGATAATASHGYLAGGDEVGAGGPFNIIDKFVFASDSNATDVGDLTEAKEDNVGHTYAAGAYGFSSHAAAGDQTRIEKFSLATDSNATDEGSLSTSLSHPAAHSSDVNGYTTGNNAALTANTIDKFSFVSTTTAVDIGDLINGRRWGSSTSSTTHGFHSGGFNADSPIERNEIDKFTFASDANATDVGDLLFGNYAAASFFD